MIFPRASILSASGPSLLSWRCVHLDPRCACTKGQSTCFYSQCQRPEHYAGVVCIWIVDLLALRTGKRTAPSQGSLMQWCGLQPDVITYSSRIDACAKGGRSFHLLLFSIASGQGLLSWHCLHLDVRFACTKGQPTCFCSRC